MYLARVKAMDERTELALAFAAWAVCLFAILGLL